MRDERLEALAQNVWDAMTENERTGVRFGLFPAKAMEAAEVVMKAQGIKGRLSVALMTIASTNGGMRA
jgi:hypothetical protein